MSNKTMASLAIVLVAIFAIVFMAPTNGKVMKFKDEPYATTFVQVSGKHPSEVNRWLRDTHAPRRTNYHIFAMLDDVRLPGVCNYRVDLFKGDSTSTYSGVIHHGLPFQSIIEERGMMVVGPDPTIRVRIRSTRNCFIQVAVS